MQNTPPPPHTHTEKKSYSLISWCWHLRLVRENIYHYLISLIFLVWCLHLRLRFGVRVGLRVFSGNGCREWRRGPRWNGDGVAYDRLMSAHYNLYWLVCVFACSGGTTMLLQSAATQPDRLSACRSFRRDEGQRTRRTRIYGVEELYKHWRELTPNRCSISSTLPLSFSLFLLFVFIEVFFCNQWQKRWIKGLHHLTKSRQGWIAILTFSVHLCFCSALDPSGEEVFFSYLQEQRNLSTHEITPGLQNMNSNGASTG